MHVGRRSVLDRGQITPEEKKGLWQKKRLCPCAFVGSFLLSSSDRISLSRQGASEDWRGGRKERST